GRCLLEESPGGEVEAGGAVQHGCCDLFNIRLSKCGGFIPSLRLAQLAKRHGLGYQLGCQVGETAILSAAGRHFATSVADTRYLEGSYDRYLVWETLSWDETTLGRGGGAPLFVGSGRGVTTAPPKLANVTVRKETLLG